MDVSAVHGRGDGYYGLYYSNGPGCRREVPKGVSDDVSGVRAPGENSRGTET